MHNWRTILEAKFQPIFRYKYIVISSISRHQWWASRVSNRFPAKYFGGKISFSEEFLFDFKIVTKQLKHPEVREQWLKPLPGVWIETWTRFKSGRTSRSTYSNLCSWFKSYMFWMWLVMLKVIYKYTPANVLITRYVMSFDDDTIFQEIHFRIMKKKNHWITKKKHRKIEIDHSVFCKIVLMKTWKYTSWYLTNFCETLFEIYPMKKYFSILSHKR